MNGQRGYCTVFLLIGILFLSLLFSRLTALAETEFLTQTDYVEGAKAAYLAEAGAHEALVKVKRGEVEQTGKESKQIAARTFAGGHYEAYVKKDGAKGVILSVGTVKKAKRQMTVEFQEVAGEIHAMRWRR